MMGKIWISLAIPVVGTMLLTAAVQEEKAEETEETRPFQWIRSDSPTRGERFGKHRLSRLARFTDYGPEVELEEETRRVDEHTTHRTIRAYRQDPAGRRQLYELVEEELKSTPDGKTQAVRTLSRRDANGRMEVMKRERQETVPRGADTVETTSTVELVGPNRRLAPAERIQQTERLMRDDSVSIERTQSVVDGNGKWQTSERRVAKSWESDGVVQSEETLYRRDGLRKMALFEESFSQEWTAEDGTLYRTTETSRPNFDGKLELMQQVQIEQRKWDDGTVQTVEQVALRAVGSPSDELLLQERVIEETSPGGADRSRKSVSIEQLDALGQFRLVNSYTVSSTESQGKKRTTLQ